MPRAFLIPGVIFLFCAFVLLFLVSISLPYITDIDIARVHFKNGHPTVGADTNAINEIRVRSFLSSYISRLTRLLSSLAAGMSLNP